MLRLFNKARLRWDLAALLLQETGGPQCGCTLARGLLHQSVVRVVTSAKPISAHATGPFETGCEYQTGEVVHNTLICLSQFTNILPTLVYSCAPSSCCLSMWTNLGTRRILFPGRFCFPNFSTIGPERLLQRRKYAGLSSHATRSREFPDGARLPWQTTRGLQTYVGRMMAPRHREKASSSGDFSHWHTSHPPQVQRQTAIPSKSRARKNRANPQQQIQSCSARLIAVGPSVMPIHCDSTSESLARRDSRPLATQTCREDILKGRLLSETKSKLRVIVRSFFIEQHSALCSAAV
jgi:hypothetical protein